MFLFAHPSTTTGRTVFSILSTVCLFCIVLLPATVQAQSISDLVVSDGLLEDRVDLTWSVTTLGNSRILIERLEQTSTPVGAETIAVLARTETSYSDRIAKVGVDYEYCVVVATQGLELQRACALGRRVLFEPEMVTASDSTSVDDVFIRWKDRSNREASYEVVRIDPDNNAETLATLNADAGFYNDTTALAGIRYEYCITAIDVDGNKSRQVCDEGSRAFIAPPQSITASDGEYPFVRISWDIAASVEQAPFVLIYRDDEQIEAIIRPDMDVQHFDDLTATEDVSHSYCIAVSNGGQESAPVCDEGTRTLPFVQDFRAVDGFEDRVELFWTYNGIAHSGFQIHRDSEVIDVAPGETSYVDFDAPLDPTALYCITAISDKDPAAPNASEQVCLQNRVGRLPILAPFGVAATEGTLEDRVDVTWQSASNTAMLFNVYRDDQLIETLPPNLLAFADQNIPSDSPAEYCISSMTIIGASEAIQEEAAGVVSQQLKAPYPTLEGVSRQEARLASIQTAVQELLDPGMSTAGTLVESDQVCVTGHRSILPPTAFTATYDNSEDHIQLSWQPESNVAQGHKIYRENSGALNLDEVDDHVEVQHDIPALRDAFTIEAWVKVKSNSGNTIFIKTHESGESTMVVSRSSTGELVLTLISGSNVQNIVASNNMPVDEWTHIAVSWKSDSIVQIYQNGVLAFSGPHNFAGFDDTFSNAPFIMGSPAVNTNMLLDEVRIWSKADLDFVDLMNTGLSGDEDGLVGYWSFNDTQNNRASDRTGIGVTNYRGNAQNSAADTPPAIQTEVATLTANRTSFGDYNAVSGVEQLYNIRAFDALSESNPVPVAGRRTLAPPTQLEAADGLSETAVQLTWQDNSRAETGYTITRDGSVITNPALPPNTTSFVDTGANFGKTNTYEVRAVDATGASDAASDEGNINISPPQGVNASTFYDKKVVVAWTDQSEIETGYEIFRDDDLIATLDSNSGSYTDSLFREVLTTLDKPAGIDIDEINGFAYFSDAGAGNISRFNLKEPGVEVLVTGRDEPASLQLDVSQGKMYWVEMGSSDIFRSNLDGSDIKKFVDNPSDAPSVARVFMIDIDKKNNHLYYNTAEKELNADGFPSFRGVIKRINFDGSDNKIIFDGRGLIPGSVPFDVDEENRQIYLSDIEGSINVFPLEDSPSTDQKPVSLAKIELSGEIRDIEIDVNARKLYWTDYRSGLYRANFDGSFLETIFDPNTSTALTQAALAIDQTNQQVFWTPHTSNPDEGRILSIPFKRRFEYCVSAVRSLPGNQDNASTPVCIVGAPEHVMPEQAPLVDAIEGFISGGGTSSLAALGTSVAIHGDVMVATGDNQARFFERDQNNNWQLSTLVTGSDNADGVIFVKQSKIAINDELVVISTDRFLVTFQKMGDTWTAVQVQTNSPTGLGVAIYEDEIIWELGDGRVLINAWDGSEWEAGGPVLRATDGGILEKDKAKQFGRAVDISENYAIVADPRYDVQPGVVVGTQKVRGAVVIYERSIEASGETWSPIETFVGGLVTLDATKFGDFVALNDDFAFYASGSKDVQILERRNNQFVLAKNIEIPPNPVNTGQNRRIIGLSVHDDYLVIGYDTGNLVYRLINGEWTQVADLKADGATISDVAVHDGDIMVGSADTQGGGVFHRRVLVKPANLVVSDGTFQDRVQIRWIDENLYESGYNIYRRNATGALEPVGTAEANQEVFNDFTAVSGAATEYCVAAYDNALSLEGELLGESNLACASGWLPANGTISGRVATETGAGTIGVDVCMLPSPNRSLLLDGNGGHVRIPHHENFQFTNGVTFEAWIKHNDNNETHTILDKGNAFRFYTIGDLVVLISDVKFGLTAKLPDLKLGEWVHLAVSLDPTNNWQFYMNGSPIDSDPNLPSLTEGFTINEHPIFVGKVNDQTLSTNKASYDEVRIWNTVRTPAEIQAFYNQSLHGSELGLIGYWPFDEGSGQTVADLTGNGANGTLIDGVYWSDQGGFDVCATTDQQGNYSLSNLRYGESNEFVVTPGLEQRTFNPAFKKITLATDSPVQNEVAFLDQTAFTVAGQVSFEDNDLYEKNACTVEGVEILVDGEVKAITEADGSFAVSVLPSLDENDVRTIAPRLVVPATPPDLHTFTPTELKQTITGNLFDVNFINNKTRDLLINFGGSCDAARNLGTAEVKIFTENGCFLSTQTLQPGQNLITLPPQKYLVQIESVDALSGFDAADITQFFDNLGALEVDLRVEKDTVDFIYHAPLGVSFIRDFPTPSASCSTISDGRRSLPTGLPILSENNTFTLALQVEENYGNGISCPLTEGTVRVVDDIGDGAEPLEVDLSTTTDGVVNYAGVVGEPNIFAGARVDNVDRSYQKSINFIAQVPGGEAVTATRWAYVEGDRDQGETFFTGLESDPVPIHVLHDPPGDNSYSYIEKGSRVCRALKFESVQTVNNEYELKLQIGTKTDIDFIFTSIETDIYAGGRIKAAFGVGEKGENEVVTCLDIEEKISTSSSPNFVGPDADVFMGVGYNFVVGEVIDLGIQQSDNACTINLDANFAINVDEEDPFHTVFGYTRSQIENVIIPDLTRIAGTADINTLISEKAALDANRWKSLIATSVDNTHESYELIENRSFSAGVNYEASETRTQSQLASTGITDVIFIEGGLFAKIDAENTGGEIMALFATEVQVDETQTNTKEDELKIGYVLSDDDLGDVFSVDIGRAVRSKQKPYLADIIKQHKENILQYSWGEVRKQCEAAAQEFNQPEEFGPEIGNCIVQSIGATATSIRDVIRLVIWVDGAPIRCEDENGNPTDCAFPEGREVLPSFLYHPGGEHIFTLRNGTSSNPWEAGTKKRDRAKIGQIQPPERLGVLANQPAVFTLPLNNDGETNELREYILRTVHNQNEGGATIRASGGVISGGISYYLEKGKTTNVTLQVDRGPTQYNYDSLAVMLYPSGEYPIWQDGGLNGNGIILGADTAYFHIQYEAPCTDIALLRPKDRWFFNGKMQTDGDLVDVIMHDYVISDELVQGGDLTQFFLRSQYRKEGSSDWINIAQARADTLEQSSIRTAWLPPQDGRYEMRAMSQCGGSDRSVFSSVITGLVDTKAPVVFGTPEPADEVLTLGEDIAITFNEEIDCESVNKNGVTLNIVNNDGNPNQILGLQFACDGKTAIISPPQGFDWSVVEGQLLEASVSGVTDLLGNKLEERRNWNFVVQRSAFAFSPSNLIAEATRGVATTVEATLSNGRTESVSFDVPETLTLNALDQAGAETGVSVDVSIASDGGDVPPGGTYPLRIDLPGTLEEGRYKGVLTVEGINPAGNAIGASTLFLQTDVLCQAPTDWDVRPNEFEHSMSIIANLEIEGIRSADPEDQVAAFINGEVRGVGTLSDLQGNGIFAVSMLIYSNQASGETVMFKAWDADACTVYEETSLAVTFVSNSNQGTPAEELTIQAPAPLTAGIPLSAGWTWFSINTLPGDAGINTLFDGLGSEGDIIKGQRSFAVKDPMLGWQGSLGALSAGQGYLTRLSRSGHLQPNGTPVPANLPIDLAAGWNWIGYHPQDAQPVNDAMTGFPFAEGDLIKSQFAFVQFDGTRWVGSLTDMQPGFGYQMRVANEGTLVYVTQAAGQTGGSQITSLASTGRQDQLAGFEQSAFDSFSENASAVARDSLRDTSTLSLASCLMIEDGMIEDGPEAAFDLTAYSVDPNQFTQTMTYTASLELDGRQLQDPSVCLTVRSGNEMRGLGRLQYVESKESYMAFLTMYGNEEGGESLTIEVHHPEWTVPIGISSGLTYEPGSHAGSLAEPEVISVSRPMDLPIEFTLNQNYPNPFNPVTSIRYALPRPAAVKIQLYDALGREVALLVEEELKAGWHEFSFDASHLASGVYFYRMNAPDFNNMRKMVLIK